MTKVYSNALSVYVFALGAYLTCIPVGIDSKCLAAYLPNSASQAKFFSRYSRIYF